MSRANGSRSPRSHAAAGIEKPRFGARAMRSGSSVETAWRRSRFFESPRTFIRRGSASASSATTWSQNGTRVSSECAMLARSVFTSRSSAR